VWLNLKGVGSLGLITAVGVTATWLPSGDGATQSMATGIHSSPEATSAWSCGKQKADHSRDSVTTTAREAADGGHAVGLVGDRAGGCRSWILLETRLPGLLGGSVKRTSEFELAFSSAVRCTLQRSGADYSVLARSRGWAGPGPGMSIALKASS
jgi:hypothetical protein